MLPLNMGDFTVQDVYPGYYCGLCSLLEWEG